MKPIFKPTVVYFIRTCQKDIKVSDTLAIRLFNVSYIPKLYKSEYTNSAVIIAVICFLLNLGINILNF
jgi:hypothetical protein